MCNDMKCFHTSQDYSGTGKCINITSDHPYLYELRVDGKYYGHNIKIRYWNLAAKLNLLRYMH